MKKWLIGLCLTLIFCAACLSALGEGEDNLLLRIYDGDTLVASGAAVGSDRFMLTGGAFLRAATSPTVRFGDQAFAITAMDGEGFDAPVLMQLDAATGVTSWFISSEPDWSSLTYLGLCADGAAVSGNCSRVAPAFAGRHVAMTLTAQPGLLPGALILDQGGCIAGVVVSVYGEGSGRYLAFTNESIYFLLSSMIASDDSRPQTAPVSQSETALMPAALPVTDAQAFAENGCLVVDWSESELAPENGQQITIIVEDSANPYSSTISANIDDSSASFPAIPGHSGLLWVVQTTGEPDMDMLIAGGAGNAVYAIPYTVDEVEPCTDYAFRNADLHLGLIPVGTEAADTEVIPAFEGALTAELLTENVPYLQVTSVYEVDAQLSCTLTFVLYTPDGAAYTELAGWIYDPTYGNCDNWHAALDDLLARAARFAPDGSLTPGEYAIVFYIDGKEGGRLAFTIE